jgi:hypothetical protein
MLATKHPSSAAIAMVLTLNNTCTGLNLAPALGRHCTKVEVQAMISASAGLNWACAIRMNGRLTDILPISPGSFKFESRGQNGDH